MIVFISRVNTSNFVDNSIELPDGIARRIKSMIVLEFAACFELQRFGIKCRTVASDGFFDSMYRPYELTRCKQQPSDEHLSLMACRKN